MKVNMCHYAGCDVITAEYYCPKHKIIMDKTREERRKKLFKDTKRTTSRPYHHLYESSKWRAMRRNFIANNPNCICCGAKATIADHIIAHKGNESLFYNINNLQPMCWSCHSAKTLKENNYFKLKST